MTFSFTRTTKNNEHHFIQGAKKFCAPPHLGFITIDELENMAYCTTNTRDLEFISTFLDHGFMYALPIYRQNQVSRYYSIRAPFVFYDYTK